jgi:hypothetical protein
MFFDSGLTLTERELAYLRRFRWEVFHRHDGPGSTVDQRKCHFNDMADLTNVAGVTREIVSEPSATNSQEPPTKVIPFPWDSLASPRSRADEIRQLEAEAVSRETNS